MSRSLRRLAVCINNFKNELLIMRVSLNVKNVFIFSIMQLLRRNSLKNIIMIHYQNNLTEGSKNNEFDLKNIFNSSARSR